ncbi:ATP phosphoribosyltransferase regulatory subunit [Marinomonas piezotolerans]|uniref:ATP phosphoribosyltransferase regulatory subunit n=1 Tax=Marinomonas piezotolerans TaxID=2213058 RepID=A0A370U5D8_9GAMM|nr:ATP phosphoribosyltransferase regulatory subunit [Marinomonas piezotolerans]RDL42985.1 ATP phosphoribosyltransferase regulatory subunit [Marinomonas piezotolerans]
MTLADRWLLPDGVDEALPKQAAKIEHLRRTLLNLHENWGYQLVIPPLLEYLDSLLIGAGSDLDLETFKVIDQLSGRLMGIRADFTSQVARIDAHCLKHEGVQRLSYCGSVLRTTPAGLDGTRSPIQLGAELYGHNNIESDLEVLSLMLETLTVAGLSKLVLDVGHIDVVRGVMAASGLTEEQEQKLASLYRAKGLPELEAFVASLQIEEQAKQWLLALPRLCGGVEVLDKAEQALRDVSESVNKALSQIRVVVNAVSARFKSVGLHFDLSDMESYSYHTGLVFAAYVPGYGNAVARGGRYDFIGEVFGRSRPATGFSTDVKTLVSLADVRLEEHKKVLAPIASSEELWQAIQALRADGYIVVEQLEQTPDISEFDFQLSPDGDGWKLVSI